MLTASEIIGSPELIAVMAAASALHKTASQHPVTMEEGLLEPHPFGESYLAVNSY